MAGRPEPPAVLTRHSALPPERIRYVPAADAAAVAAIDRGVLLLMAFWSGASLLSFRRLTETLAGLVAEVEVVVADLDGSPDLYDLPELRGKVHGHGEVAWILGGRIVAVSSGPSGPDSFASHAAALSAVPGP